MSEAAANVDFFKAFALGNGRIRCNEPEDAVTFRHWFKGLADSKVIRSVAVLVGGTALAHGITAAALPIITRLYTPADFTIMAVFASLLSILSVAAALRFDLAVPIPEDDGEAINLLALAFGCVVIVATILAIVVLAAPKAILEVFNQPGLAPWLWLLPFGVLLAGSYNALQMWFVRKKEFTSIARSRVTQSAAAASTQVAMGWLHWAPLGLIAGQMLNTGAGCAALGYRLLRHDRGALHAVNVLRMRKAFASYDRFPKFSTLEALANSASIQLPILVIAAVASGPEAGYLALAMTAMQVPMGLVGTAVLQVYMSRAPEEHRAGRLDTFTTSVFGALIKSGVGPLIFAGFVAPALFTIVFGAEWRRAGILVAWMTPWFVMQFLSVPVSTALHVTGHQRAAFVLQFFALALRVGAVYAVSIVAADLVSEAYALSGFVFYLLYLAVVLRVVSAKAATLTRETLRGLPIVIAWAAAGWIVSVASSKLHWPTH